MHSISTSPTPAGTPVTVCADGSVRFANAEFALHIALRRPAFQPAAVLVALTLQDGHGKSQLWEFPVVLMGQRVFVGGAVPAEGGAPLVPGAYREANRPLRIDEVFAHAFQEFSAVNKERLLWAGILQNAWTPPESTNQPKRHP